MKNGILRHCGVGGSSWIYGYWSISTSENKHFSGWPPVPQCRAHICHKYHKLYLWRKNDKFKGCLSSVSLTTLSTLRPECQRCLFPFLLVDGSLHCLVTIQRYIHPDETMFEVVTMLDACDNDHDENAQDWWSCQLTPGSLWGPRRRRRKMRRRGRRFRFIIIDHCTEDPLVVTNVMIDCKFRDHLGLKSRVASSMW